MSKNCVFTYHFPIQPDPGDIVAFKDIHGNESSYECIAASGTKTCTDCEMEPCLCVSVDCVLYGDNVIYKKINNE